MKVEFELLVLAIARDAKFIQRIDHFNAVRTNLLVHAIWSKNIRHADRVLKISATDTRERVSDSQIRILTKARDEKHLARAIMRVPIRTVIEIAIAGSCMRERIGRLVQWELIGRNRHWYSPSSKMSAPAVRVRRTLERLEGPVGTPGGYGALVAVGYDLPNWGD